jgi:hypothetical protein
MLSLDVVWIRFAHDLLSKFMRSQGFDVEEHAFGLETAWRATFQHGEGRHSSS